MLMCGKQHEKTAQDPTQRNKQESTYGTKRIQKDKGERTLNSAANVLAVQTCGSELNSQILKKSVVGKDRRVPRARPRVGGHHPSSRIKECSSRLCQSAVSWGHLRGGSRS